MAESVTVENLSKSYELGALLRETQLRDQLVNLVRAPFRKRRPKEILWALRDVSFRVNEGEVVGIVGRNGAGKSTLLKILSKITYPTSGTVKARGRIASMLEVGTGFHEELTGRENVYLNASIIGMRKREVDAKFDQIVAFAGVERFIDTPIKRYSSGMRMRLGFAVAAHLEPDVLIVDEVLAVGDAVFQKKCITAMQDMRGGGRTVLFVSHNMSAVENLCSRGIWIANGQVRMDGTTHEVIEAYMGSFASSEGASNDLAQADGRRGSGEIRYTRVELIAKSGELQTVTRSGKSVTIRLHFHASEAIERPSFGIKINSEMGTLITDTSTWLHGIDIPAGQRRGRLRRPGDRHAQSAAGPLLAVAVGGLGPEAPQLRRHRACHEPGYRGGADLQHDAPHRQPLRTGVLSAALAARGHRRRRSAR